MVFSQTDQQRIIDLDEVTQGGQQQMFGKSLPPPGVQGSTMYSDDWYLGDIIFTNGLVYNDYFIRYDIAAGILETKKEERFLSFKSEDVQKFSWYNDYNKSSSTFVNCRKHKISGTSLIGFFEVMVEDQISLLAHPVITVKDPDYVEGLDVGNRDFRVKKEEEYYFAFDDGLFEIKKNTGKNIKALGNKFPELREFVKSNKLSFRDRIDLVQIAQFMNKESTSTSNF
jgi:hypothetical protein